MTNVSSLIVGRPTIDSEEEKKKIMDSIGDISGVDVFGTLVLVAMYIPDKSGSIINTVGTQREAQYQGKVGLVLKKGHLAFKNDANNDFGPDTVESGDWVHFDYAAGQDLAICPPGTFTKIICKKIRDTSIDGKISRPDAIY